MIRQGGKDQRGALADVERAIELQPEGGDGYMVRSLIHLDAGLRRHDRRRGPGDPARPEERRGVLDPGRSPRSEGEHDRAIADLTRAIELIPARERLKQVARPLRYVPLTKTGSGSFTEFLEFRLNPCEPYYQRAKAHLARHDLDRALADAEALVRFSAEEAWWPSFCYRFRGTIHNERGETKAALDDARMALELATNDEDRPGPPRRLWKNSGAK